MTDLEVRDEVRLTGTWGAAQSQNANRLAIAPLDQTAFILDDLSLKQHRKFAEYSGDISGRWIGAAAFLSPQFPKAFAAFSEIMAEIPTCQKGDGHFGAEQKLPAIDRGRDMPILWGNGRILIGLVEVYDRSRDPKALEMAKKLGDYFVATDAIYNKPANLRNVGGSYSDGFATCYFSCIEGLVGLARVTKDSRYLDEAKRIAELALSVDNFDGIHCHGRLCAVRGFADLYSLTGDRHWREAAERDWKIFMERYRLPTGGVKEVLDANCNRDEGCAVCDWLRLNLSLWHLTGQGQYADEAERSLKGHFIYQQFPNGGAGHRLLHQIGGQPVAFSGLSEEAWWCCGEHWARATADVAHFAVTGTERSLSINLAIDCEGAVAGPGGKWKVAQREAGDVLRVTLTSPAKVKATVRVRCPAWAQGAAWIEKPASLTSTKTKEAWLVEGIWGGTQEIVVHLPTALRSEATAGSAGVLLHGHDLLAAHRAPANAWLMDHLGGARPVVLWTATLPAKDGRVVVPASLAADADPSRPEQWKLLELAPLRALTGQPHEAAWFSFSLRPAAREQIATLVAKLNGGPAGRTSLGQPLSASPVPPAKPAAAWPPVTLAPARDVTLSGALGEAIQRGVARLAKPPYTEPWLRADVSFELDRIFTNYSGDVSGRFLELASLTSPPGKISPPTLVPLMKTVASFQKPDGHFGVPVDLTKPLTKRSPPITMLWGNARLLVGLVTAARLFHDEHLLASARRLGDFYVNTAEQLCSPARETDYRASGTDGESYTCCYFPAIEGLVMLYQATNDDRYLKHAERMAEFFKKFDCLPIDHSHGNLCAWRGILDLYRITGNHIYLDRAKAKWDAAVDGSFVWPLGGVGEHWFVSFFGDEGCSESDWLRFSLDLWRFTGQTRYLDAVQRLLENQYATNQCPNGGYGMAHLDSDAAGPIAAIEKIEEWPFCCSFHGPLGLHFLKGYLAAGNERSVIVNFPYDFVAPVKAAGREWLVSVHSKPNYVAGHTRMEIELAPRNEAAAHGTLLVRIPQWASDAKAAAASGDPVPASAEGGYLRIQRDFKAGDKLTIDFQNSLALEGRRFLTVQAAAGQVSRVKDVAVLAGPELLFAEPVKTGGRPILLATLEASGRLSFPTGGEGHFVTVTLPSIDATNEQIAQAIQSGKPIFLRTWPGVIASRHGEPAFKSVLSMSEIGGSSAKPRRLPFMFDLVVVPAGSLNSDVGKLASRARESENAQSAPIFGKDLEKRPEIWSSNAGWKFTPQGLLVAGGDIGLIDSEGYGDYRFEFELTVPKDGQGIAGWVVRAQDEDNCLMFQLQTADTTFHAPEFKTHPNTLRPHRRTGGQWQIVDPVALPKVIRKGEPHLIAVECRQGTVEVFLDGQRIYSQTNVDLRGGTVGFRAAGPHEQGLFRAIGLKKL